MNKVFMTTASARAKNEITLLSRIILFSVLGLLTACSADPADEVDGSKRLMGRGYGLNSAALVVEELDSAKKHFTEVLGFFIPPGEMFSKGDIAGAQKSTIALPDLFSLQLLAVNDTVAVTGRDSFVRDFVREHEGVRLYTLSSSSVDSTREWLVSREIAVDTVHSYWGTSDRPGDWSEGYSVQARSIGVAGKYPSPYLPEFVELNSFPYYRMHEFESFYIMQRGFFNHPNGVVGASAIKIAVDDLPASRDVFQKMGLEQAASDTIEHQARFKVKRAQELHLISSASPDDETAEFLEERGPGVFGLEFLVADIGATHEFLSAQLPAEAIVFDSLSQNLLVKRDYAYGIQLEFVEEPAESRLRAEQLKINYRGSLDSVARENAEVLYLKYCALCHGEEREGYAADNAPSLRSHSLIASAKGSNFLRYTIQYGRANTAMAGYYESQGGPMSLIEIELLLKWLEEESAEGEPVELSRDPVVGDIELGSTLYARHCTSCHGADGEGVSAPALANPMLLATATDEFLRYAITEGRDGTPMVAYKDSLNTEEIDALTAYLRSRASGWSVPSGDTISVPSPEEYVLNPTAESPNFDLREGLYVSAEQLERALRDSLRLVLLDARSEVAWRQTHIPGAVPVPYYLEPEEFITDIPKDSTMIVAYCACPHAASGRVISKLRDFGYENTAILDEGILVWAQLGYPVRNGQGGQ